MSLARAELPTDPDALRAFALACQAELKAAELAVQLRALEIEKLKFQIAKLRRMQFGRSSERITRQIEQLALQLEELETGEAQDIAGSAMEDRPSPRERPKRKPLPEHLPRHELVHQPEADGACVCPDCGAGMAKLGEDVTEVLDYALCVRAVAAWIGLEPLGARIAGSGSIRTGVQGQDSGATAAAGEFGGRGCLT